jgi:hypothetical protein
MPKWLIILLVVVLVIMLGCCGGFVACHWMCSHAGAALVGLAKEGMRQNGMEIDTTGNGLNLPANFPSDVPVYTDFKDKMNLVPPGGPGGTVTFEGKEDPKKVSDFYESTLTSKGWTQTASSESAGTFTSTYKKGDMTAIITTSGTGAADKNNLTIHYEKSATPETPAGGGGGGGPGAGNVDGNTPAGGNTTAKPEQAAGNTPAAAPAKDDFAGLPKTKLPSNFPSDVPIYSGLTPNYSASNKMQGTASVIMTGSGDADKIVDFYKKDLAVKGWTISDEQSFNAMTSMAFTKDKTKVTIIVNGLDAGKISMSMESKTEQ